LAKVKDILNFLERDFADINRQYDWDNSGAQLVLEDRKITKAALALDPTDKVIRETIDKGCELLITHHPLFFGNIKRLDVSKPFDKKLIDAIRAGVSIISAHTSLDLADYSLNDYVCEIMNAKVESSFVKEGESEFVKFVVFVPKGHEDSVRSAIYRAGGGHIGNYSCCTFQTDGVGTFKPGEGTNPFIGEKGEIEKVREFRIETIIEKKFISKLLTEVVEAHPYEEVAHDIYPLNMGKPYGLGRIGVLDEELSLKEFIYIVKERLGIDSLRTNQADSDMRVKKFAVVTGSGASMWKRCLSAGVDVLLTGDMKHHDAIDAAENGVVIVDAGHFETEKIYMDWLAGLIEKKFNIETILIDEGPSIVNWR